MRNRPALREIVGAIVRDVAIADLERIMDEANIPFSPVRTPSDLFDDPQLNAFGRAMASRMPKGNVANLPGLPFCIDDEAPALRMQPPAAGEHTDAILERAWVIRRRRLRTCAQQGCKLISICHCEEQGDEAISGCVCMNPSQDCFVASPWQRQIYPTTTCPCMCGCRPQM